MWIPFPCSIQGLYPTNINWLPTHINSLTASSPQAARTPIHFPTDRECLERISPTVGKVELSEVTYGWIANTMELGTLKLSENLRDEIAKNPLLEVIGPAEELEFDADGNLSGLTISAEPVGLMAR